jgi:hypothetical protein
MQIDINIRGNGACALCAFDSDCRVKKALAEAIADFPDRLDSAMEVVVYSCPLFKEKN